MYFFKKIKNPNLYLFILPLFNQESPIEINNLFSKGVLAKMINFATK